MLFQQVPHELGFTVPSLCWCIPHGSADATVQVSTSRFLLQLACLPYLQGAAGTAWLSGNTHLTPAPCSHLEECCSCSNQLGIHQLAHPARQKRSSCIQVHNWEITEH